LSTYIRSAHLRRLLLAGLMIATAATATAATANASTASKPSTGSKAAATASSCGPTYNTASGSASSRWPGASVPWRSVGKGWILGTVTAKLSGLGPQTLYLVAPGGHRYLVGAAPSGATLTDWSGSMNALFVSQPTNGSKATIYVLNLKTGQGNSFPVNAPGGGYISLSFSRPSGQGIFVETNATATGGYRPLQRYSLTGARQQCYPNSFAGAGSGEEGYTESPAGPDLVLDTQNGLEVMSNAGQPIRFLRPPHGFSSCSALNWWSSQTVVANCSNKSTNELWAVPLSGAKPTQLSSKGQAAVFFGAWRLAGHTYAQEAACGSSWLERLNSNGTGTQLTIPGAADAGNVKPLGTYGNQIALLVTGGCDGHTPFSKVDWYNPASNKATTVLGAPAGSGFVLDALLYQQG